MANPFVLYSRFVGSFIRLVHRWFAVIVILGFIVVVCLFELCVCWCVWMALPRQSWLFYQQNIGHVLHSQAMTMKLWHDMWQQYLSNWFSSIAECFSVVDEPIRIQRGLSVSNPFSLIPKQQLAHEPTLTQRWQHTIKDGMITNHIHAIDSISARYDNTVLRKFIQTLNSPLVDIKMRVYLNRIRRLFHFVYRSYVVGLASSFRLHSVFIRLFVEYFSPFKRPEPVSFRVIKTQ